MRMKRNKFKGVRDYSASLPTRRMLGVNLAYLRDCKGMAQIDLNIDMKARVNIGIAIQRISGWELGKENMTLNTLCRISTYWGVSLGELLECDLAASDNLRGFDRRTGEKIAKDKRVNKRKGLPGW